MSGHDEEAASVRAFPGVMKTGGSPALPRRGSRLTRRVGPAQEPGWAGRVLHGCAGRTGDEGKTDTVAPALSLGCGTPRGVSAGTWAGLSMTGFSQLDQAFKLHIRIPPSPPAHAAAFAS